MDNKELNNNGWLLPFIFKMTHPNVIKADIPYYWKRSVMTEIWHLIRKGICQNIAPNCVLAPIRKGLYKLCGLKIGKGGFIGMKCYFDDLCIDNIIIGNNVTISYGVYFACHGPNQGHNKIVIKDNTYIGMRASIIAPTDIEIGDRVIVGAQTLVNKSIPAGKTAVGIPCRIIDK